MRRCLALLLVGLLAGAAPAEGAASGGGTAPAAKAKAKRCPKAKPRAGTKAKAKRCPKAKAKTKTKTVPTPSSPTPADPQPPKRDDQRPGSPAPGSGSGGSPPSGGGDAGGGGGGGAPAELNAVGVKAYDRDGIFTFETTRSTVRAGELTVSFRNYDLDEHNLWIEGTAPTVPPRELSGTIGHHGNVTTTAAVAAGAYRFFCTVPGHGSMSRALTVSG